MGAFQDLRHLVCSALAARAQRNEKEHVGEAVQQSSFQQQQWDGLLRWAQINPAITLPRTQAGGGGGRDHITNYVTQHDLQSLQRAVASPSPSE